MRWVSQERNYDLGGHLRLENVVIQGDTVVSRGETGVNLGSTEETQAGFGVI